MFCSAKYPPLHRSILSTHIVYLYVYIKHYFTFRDTSPSVNHNETSQKVYPLLVVAVARSPNRNERERMRGSEREKLREEKKGFEILWKISWATFSLRYTTRVYVSTAKEGVEKEEKW